MENFKLTSSRYPPCRGRLPVRGSLSGIPTETIKEKVGVRSWILSCGGRKFWDEDRLDGRKVYPSKVSILSSGLVLSHRVVDSDYRGFPTLRLSHRTPPPDTHSHPLFSSGVSCLRDTMWSLSPDELNESVNSPVCLICYQPTTQVRETSTRH